MGSLIPGMQDASGLLYRRNRYYSPETGQFTQTDPIGLAGGLNTYGFAEGDPVSFQDPYGLSAEEVRFGTEAGTCPWCWGFVLRAAPTAARVLPVAAGVTVASSRVLRVNLRLQGILPRLGHAAHHIVAGGHRHAAARAARAVLNRFQININDAANGVYLPNSRVAQAASGGAYHRTLHTDTYFRAVNDLLQRATTRDEALDALRYIATQLQQNTFPK